MEIVGDQVLKWAVLCDKVISTEWPQVTASISTDTKLTIFGRRKKHITLSFWSHFYCWAVPSNSGQGFKAQCKASSHLSPSHPDKMTAFAMVVLGGLCQPVWLDVCDLSTCREFLLLR